jgi:F-type H+-transporting ATPase subunit delta
MLPKLEGFATAVVGALDASTVQTVVSDLASLEQTVLSRSDLRGVLGDTSINGVSRGAIVRELFSGKISDVTLRIAVYAAANVPAQDVSHAFADLAYAARLYQESGSHTFAPLSLLEARRRIAGVADALLDGINSGDFATIEEELFRWARTVEANDELRRLLLDRDAPVASRVATTQALLSGKVNPLTLSLATFVIVAGRPRDVVGTLDFLVDYVAQARDWRVARVRTARDLDENDKQQLVGSLSALTGKSVELQIAEDPTLLGGVLVEVGDLRLDASTRGRLGQLRDAVAAGHVSESLLNRNDK